MKQKLLNGYVMVLGVLIPHAVFAQDVAMKIESLRSRVVPVGFAVGSLATVLALIGAIASERVGWSWFVRCLVGIGGLAMVNALIMMVRNSLGGF